MQFVRNIVRRPFRPLMQIIAQEGAEGRKQCVEPDRQAQTAWAHPHDLHRLHRQLRQEHGHCPIRGHPFVGGQMPQRHRSGHDARSRYGAPGRPIDGVLPARGPRQLSRRSAQVALGVPTADRCGDDGRRRSLLELSQPRGGCSREGDPDGKAAAKRRRHFECRQSAHREHGQTDARTPADIRPFSRGRSQGIRRIQRLARADVDEYRLPGRNRSRSDQAHRQALGDVGVGRDWRRAGVWRRSEELCPNRGAYRSRIRQVYCPPAGRRRVFLCSIRTRRRIGRSSKD